MTTPSCHACGVDKTHPSPGCDNPSHAPMPDGKCENPQCINGSIPNPEKYGFDGVGEMPCPSCAKPPVQTEGCTDKKCWNGSLWDGKPCPHPSHKQAEPVICPACHRPEYEHDSELGLRAFATPKPNEPSKCPNEGAPGHESCWLCNPDQQVEYEDPEFGSPMVKS